MVDSKRLSANGDKVIPLMIETSSLLGIDLIEVVWTPRNGQPRHTPAEIIGFKFPVMGDVTFTEDVIEANGWIDGTLMFYPDSAGRCWGYIYDTPENRHLICTSLSNGQFRIVDRRIREEIYKEAEETGYASKPAERTEVMVKVSKRERDAEDKIKNAEKRIEDLERMLKIAKEEADISKNEKLVRVEKRLKGVKIPDKEIFEDEKVENAN